MAPTTSRKKIMKRPTIMQRLILLTAVPVIALILSSGTLILDSFDRYQNADQARSIMEVAVAAGDLIHPMQVERGMTVGSIQSYDQKFADGLPSIRTNIDKQLAAYKRSIEGVDTSSMPRLKKAVEEAQRKLDGLTGTREQVDQYDISAEESPALFTGAIGHLMDVMSSAAGYNKDPAEPHNIMSEQQYS